ncbi:ATP-binding protein, partial [bacterium]|nr:ATP-binding protein [bacterium]
MSVAKKIRVEVKRDHLAQIASGSPELALAEMIWNALDADSTTVDVRFYEGPLGVDEITITDNGTGIPYGQAESLFEALGGSWKARREKTDQGRFLHGKEGKGRFKAFVLGRVVQWKVTYKANGQLKCYTIEGLAESLDEFSITDEEIIENGKTGVDVRIIELTKKFHLLDKEKALERLTPLLALYLCNYTSLRLTIEGTAIDPNEIIRNRHKFDLEPVEQDGVSYPVQLEIIEWNEIKEREVWFCDDKGFPLEPYNRQMRGIGEFGFNAYLKSEFFQHLHYINQLGLSELNSKVAKICDQATKLIKDYFLKRTIESAKDQLNKWKEDKVYPYEDEPSSPVEVAERQMFDIVAININENLPDFDETDKKTKAFQFKILRQAVEKSPEDLQVIINEVLQLPRKKQEQLAELLKDVSLSGIISASKLVSDRLKFLSGLDLLLFDDDLKKHLKERSQLHRILAENTWIFGHAFSLSVDDRSLTEVLRKHSEILESDVVIHDPVKRIDGRTGIVDLMMSRSIPRNHANELEHL